MRFFKFSVSHDIRNFACDDNGWKYSFKQCLKFGFASLKTPIVKETTYSKGPTVRYVKHNAFCVGFMKGESSFYGIAFFDLPIRLLIVLLICCGVGYASESVISGIIWSCLFYLLISVLSLDDDESLLLLIERKLQL